MEMIFLYKRINLFIITMTIAFVCSCNIHRQNTKNENIDENKREVIYAERLNVIHTDSCTIITIRDPWQGAAGVTQTYYLVGRNSGINLSLPASRVIKVPVEKIICMSATHLAMIKALGESPSVVAVSGQKYIYDSLISSNIKLGVVKDVGYESGLNTELILKISPDLVMMYGIGSESVSYTGKIEELGIKVIFNADYLENHPLGKAEWIRLFGALYCREKLADSIFMAESELYNTIKDDIRRQLGNRPKIMLGLPFKDTWYISPGNSYISRLIDDAGGSYLWAGTESSYSMPLSIEDVFTRSLKADFWLNTGTASSRNEIVSVDPRLSLIPCFEAGYVYNNNKRINQDGGNDYWETGALYPDKILKDIASIIHPDILPGHELNYYRKLE